MKFLDKYNQCKTWQEKCKIINLYHQIKCAKYKTWNLRKTASYFGLSLGYTSEALWLADNLHKVEGMKMRKEALELLKKELKKK